MCVVRSWAEAKGGLIQWAREMYDDGVMVRHQKRLSRSLAAVCVSKGIVGEIEIQTGSSAIGTAIQTLTQPTRARRGSLCPTDGTRERRGKGGRKVCH